MVCWIYLLLTQNTLSQLGIECIEEVGENKWGLVLSIVGFTVERQRKAA